MSCPTCSHTMQPLGETDIGLRWWCSRCGTLKTDGRFGGIDTPKLVERCRKFADLHIPATSGYAALWVGSGIAEAIDTPENRPATG